MKQLLLARAFTLRSVPACRADAWTDRLFGFCTRNRITVAGKKADVSRISDWDAGDFQAAGGVVGFIEKYRKPPLAPDAKVSYLSYDWSLNDAAH